MIKVHRKAFLLVPKSGQEVMITMVKSYLKNCLTFARAPCSVWAIINIPIAPLNLGILYRALWKRGAVLKG